MHHLYLPEVIEQRYLCDTPPPHFLDGLNKRKEIKKLTHLVTVQARQMQSKKMCTNTVN